MSKQISELKIFVENFFSNLGAEIKYDHASLIISKVPTEFEEFCAKKSPYRLSFDKADEDSTDYITKGSTMLKSIMSYLESRGQTTLIKINFEKDYKKELENYLILRNSKIESFTKNPSYKPIVRFSITTTLQYLNEKEQITNNISVEEGKVTNFNFEKFSTVQGKKEEIPKTDFKKEYETAKEELKILTKKRIEETAKNLGEKLEREIHRISKHYEKQIQEFKHSLQKLIDQKESLKKQFEKTNESALKEKINKISETISLAEKSDTIAKLKKEEEFFIADEKQKHSLRVNNKLINTSIIYYPIFTFDFVLKSRESAKKVEIIYDPIKDVLLKSIFCECCKKELREIFVCSSGHLSCANCREQCSICDSSLCLACTKKRCDYCGKKLCKKCSLRCTSCYKNICKNHAVKNYADDKEYCLNCLERCEVCGEYTNKSRIKNQNGQKTCEKCLRTGILKRV